MITEILNDFFWLLSSFLDCFSKKKKQSSFWMADLTTNQKAGFENRIDFFDERCKMERKQLNMQLSKLNTKKLAKMPEAWFLI